MIEMELMGALKGWAVIILALAFLVRAIGYAASQIIWAKRRDPRKS